MVSVSLKLQQGKKNKMLRVSQQGALDLQILQT